MAPVVPDPEKIKTFRNEAAFESWLRRNHARETEVWVRIYKKGSGIESITAMQAIDVVLCWGWIDAIRKSYDAQSFLQRYTPRRARSLWSQINCANVARLTAAGRMTEHGQRQIDAAKADGRWDAAYAPLRSASKDTIPGDLREAIEASPRARKTFETLNRPNLFSLTFRTNNMKTAAGRARKIAALVDMLERGETIIPLPAKATQAAHSTTPSSTMTTKAKKPAKAAKSASQAKPVKTVRPVETMKPVETIKPVGTMKPAKTMKPTKTMNTARR